ncbi:MAG: hypothetical protein IPO17_01215 [Flavobacteriales bacterium]|nr:hypothetical protein [Flavobacteriales bacterium]
MSLNAVSKHILDARACQTGESATKVGRDRYLSYRPEPLDTAAKWIG